LCVQIKNPPELLNSGKKRIKKWEKAARNGEIIKGQHLILSNKYLMSYYVAVLRELKT
jgi:hypothetical protein